MFTLGTLIWVVCVIAVFALLYWYLTTTSFPPAVKNLLIVVMGLVAIFFIYHLFAGGGVHGVAFR